MQILTGAEIEEFASIECEAGTPQEIEARLVAFLAKFNGRTVKLPSCFIKNCDSLKALFERDHVVIGVVIDLQLYVMTHWHDLAQITRFSLEVPVVITLAQSATA